MKAYNADNPLSLGISLGLPLAFSAAGEVLTICMAGEFFQTFSYFLEPDTHPILIASSCIMELNVICNVITILLHENKYICFLLKFIEIMFPRHFDLLDVPVSLTTYILQSCCCTCNLHLAVNCVAFKATSCHNYLRCGKLWKA